MPKQPPRSRDAVTVHGRTFKSFSRQEIHPVISSLLGGEKRGKLLDFPSGSGALSYRLFKEGFDVTGCDIAPENFEPSELRCVRGDLNAPFPFEAGSFDAACFIEGPEHVENPFAAFREFARVIRPGGCLVVSIPNYNNIEQRIRVLFYGTAEKAVTQERLKAEFAGHEYMLHLSPLLYAQLRFFLESSGFRIERIERDKVKWKQWAWAPLVGLIKLVTVLGGSRARERYFADQANSNAVLMGGNTLIVLARRVG